MHTYFTEMLSVNLPWESIQLVGGTNLNVSCLPRAGDDMISEGTING